MCSQALHGAVRELFDAIEGQAEAACAAEGGSFGPALTLQVEPSFRGVQSSLQVPLLQLERAPPWLLDAIQHIIVLCLAQALGGSLLAASSALAQPWARLVAGAHAAAAAAVPPTPPLVAALRSLAAQMPSLWAESMRNAAQRASMQQQRELAASLASLAAGAAAARQPLRAFGGPPPPTTGSAGWSSGPARSYAGVAPPLPPGLRDAKQQLLRQLTAADGCRYWNGNEGSCFSGAACASVASHVPGVPTSACRQFADLTRRFGGQPDAAGNWEFPRAKRPGGGLRTSEPQRRRIGAGSAAASSVVGPPFPGGGAAGGAAG